MVVTAATKISVRERKDPVHVVKKNSRSKNDEIENSDNNDIAGSCYDERSTASLPLPTVKALRANSLMASLGTGSLEMDGSVSFMPSPTARENSSRRNSFSTSTASTAVMTNHSSSVRSSSMPTIGKEHIDAGTTTTAVSSSIVFQRACSFLRVADLEMEDESIAATSIASDSSHTNDAQPQQYTHRPVVDPPPGIDKDP